MDTLSTAYFPPLSYFSLLRRGDVLLEAHENYQKQSWRNRCLILTANGVEALQVPVVHDDGTFKHPITEIRVDWRRDWLTRQKRAIDSAYGSSPFFEYYRDGIYSVLDSAPETLWDLNLGIIRHFTGLLGIPEPGLTAEFSGPVLDVHPKHPDPFYKHIPYCQVFSEKFGFVPDLSVMDLLFNEGPQACDFF